MKNFITQCVTLMIIAMVYAAPTNDPCREKKILLKQIREAAKDALHDPPSDLYVFKISGHKKRCMGKFICLANASLTIAMKDNSISNEHLLKLEHFLSAYSKNETCNLAKTEKYTVKNFLKDIEACVEHALNNNSSICHKRMNTSFSD